MGNRTSRDELYEIGLTESLLYGDPLVSNIRDGHLKMMISEYLNNIRNLPPANIVGQPEAVSQWRAAQAAKRVRLKLSEQRTTRHTPRNVALITLDKLFPLVPRHTLRRIIAQTPVPAEAVEKLLEVESKMQQRIPLANQDMFPTEEYVVATRNQLYNEFPKLWKYTIESVILEHNSDYPSIQRELSEHMTTRSKSFFDNWFQRKKLKVAPEVRLMRELDQARTDNDKNVAVELNRHLCEALETTLECQCCFGDFPADETSQCNSGHTLCFSCIDRFLGTVVRGEVGKDVMETHRHGLRCFALNDDGNPCHDFVATGEMRKCLPDNVQKMMSDLADKSNLTKPVERELDIVRCQFCGEQTAPPLNPVHFLKDRLPIMAMIMIIMFCAQRLVFYFYDHRSMPFSALVLWSIITTNFVWKMLNHIFPWLDINVMEALHILTHGPKENNIRRCINKDCAVLVCAKCGREEHKGPCFAEVPKVHNQENLENFLTKAIDGASVRICTNPDCGLQFHKQDGCNKMTCSCGWSMCYICREQVHSYDHFCQHFRALGHGKCEQCNKCDLYKCDDGKQMRKAAEDAAIVYFGQHPNALDNYSGRTIRVHDVCIRCPDQADLAHMTNT